MIIYWKLSWAVDSGRQDEQPSGCRCLKKQIFADAGALRRVDSISMTVSREPTFAAKHSLFLGVGFVANNMSYVAFVRYKSFPRAIIRFVTRIGHQRVAL